ncbi:MAG: DivIVA domain-containing protein [Cellulosilyticaceae bacterium]
MLSPVDIQNKEFKKAKLGGYNSEEVNDFLEEVLQSYQQLTKENYELKDKINMLNENIQYYRSMESTIQNALVLAEKTAQDTKAAAYDKAEQIKHEAEIKADQTLEQARKEIYVMGQKIEELKKQYIAFKIQIRQVLQSQLEMVEQQSINNVIDGSEFISGLQKEESPKAKTVEEKQNQNENENQDNLENMEEDDFYTKEYTFVAEEV